MGLENYKSLLNSYKSDNDYLKTHLLKIENGQSIWIEKPTSQCEFVVWLGKMVRWIQGTSSYDVVIPFLVKTGRELGKQYAVGDENSKAQLLPYLSKMNDLLAHYKTNVILKHNRLRKADVSHKTIDTTIGNLKNLIKPPKPHTAEQEKVIIFPPFCLTVGEGQQIALPAEFVEEVKKILELSTQAMGRCRRVSKNWNNYFSFTQKEWPALFTSIALAPSYSHLLPFIKRIPLGGHQFVTIDERAGLLIGNSMEIERVGLEMHYKEIMLLNSNHLVAFNNQFVHVYDIHSAKVIWAEEHTLHYGFADQSSRGWRSAHRLNDHQFVMFSTNIYAVVNLFDLSKKSRTELLNCETLDETRKSFHPLNDEYVFTFSSNNMHLIPTVRSSEFLMNVADLRTQYIAENNYYVILLRNDDPSHTLISKRDGAIKFEFSRFGFFQRGIDESTCLIGKNSHKIYLPIYESTPGKTESTVIIRDLNTRESRTSRIRLKDSIHSFYGENDNYCFIRTTVVSKNNSLYFWDLLTDKVSLIYSYPTDVHKNEIQMLQLSKGLWAHRIKHTLHFFEIRENRLISYPYDLEVLSIALNGSELLIDHKDARKSIIAKVNHSWD